MGSYCALHFDRIEVLSYKSGIPDVLVSLFQERDRRHVPMSLEDQDDYGEEARYVYAASRDVMLKRLDILGFTSSACRAEFERWLQATKSMWAEWSQGKDGDWAKETAEALNSFTYQQWTTRAPEALSTRFDIDLGDRRSLDVVTRQLNDPEDGWLFFETDDDRTVLRLLLDSMPDLREITLDVSDLVWGGWLDEEAEWINERRSVSHEPRPAMEPIIVIGEGRTDIDVLRASLGKLFPEVVDYFSFFDHVELNVDGGANYLVKFLKAFAAARIPTRFVAIFDNDAAGSVAFNAASRLSLPSNIRLMQLPNTELGEAYPTIGPEGEQVANINGRAASIELYLGRKSLEKENGSLRPVRWTGYVDAVNTYQGEIQGKAEVVEAFKAALIRLEDSETARTALPELTLVWERVFEVLTVNRAGITP